MNLANDLIAAGAATAGKELGLRPRGELRSHCVTERPDPDVEVEPTTAPPDLELLHFVDERDAERPVSRNGHSWESIQPPSYLEWVYRCTPRRKGRTVGSAPSSTASTRVPSRASPSPEGIAPKSLPRPPSGQRPKTGPRRPRSAASGETSPSISKSARGNSHSSTASSHPPKMSEGRPHSSLGFSHGGSSDAIALPPRPNSSMGVCQGVHHSTPSANLDLRCVSPLEEASSENPRTPSTITGYAAELRSRAEQLNAAAAAAGEKARGEVTLAIRARHICRLAGNAASRKLLHLWGEWDSPPESLTGEEDKVEKAGSDEASTEEVSDLRRKSVAKRQSTKASIPEEPQPELRRESSKPGREPQPELRRESSKSGRYSMSPLGSIFEDTANKRRSIKVVRNSCLGQMICEDPERAAKYDLVTVPAWQNNKPWPPPAVSSKQLVSRSGDVGRAKAFEMETERHARMLAHAAQQKALTRKRFAKLQAMTAVVGLSVALRKSKEKNAWQEMDERLRAEESFFFSRQPGIADLDNASNILDWAETEAYKAIFNRYSKQDDYKLTRKNMIRAMQEAGLTPTSSEEQSRFNAVLKQVLESTRDGQDRHPEDNPLTSPQGRWEMNEFILICAALRELSQRKVRVENQQVADECNMPLSEVEELRNMFNHYDPDSIGKMSARDLKSVIQLIDVRTSDMDFAKLLQNAGMHKEEFDFREFLKILTSLEESEPGITGITRQNSPPNSPVKEAAEVKEAAPPPLVQREASASIASIAQKPPRKTLAKTSTTGNLKPPQGDRATRKRVSQKTI